jgi:hypothetical protein
MNTLWIFPSLPVFKPDSKWIITGAFCLILIVYGGQAVNRVLDETGSNYQFWNIAEHENAWAVLINVKRSG